MKRDAGLKMSQTFDIVFEYNLRPFGGMNAKATMLDILSNMYLLTYASAPFWGGENRYTSGGSGYPMKSLMKSWYAGDAMGFMDGALGEISKGVSNITAAFGDLMSGDLDSLMDLGSKGASMIMANAMAGTKDTFLGSFSLLTGAPIGEWHLTVGNPLNPIMEIGNLVCSKMVVVASDTLGPDNFPDSLKFTVTLLHGMPRDSDSIQSMFNHGAGRIYKLPDDMMANLPSLNETAVDPKTGIGKEIPRGSKFGTDLKDAKNVKNSAQALARQMGLAYGTGEPVPKKK